MHRRKRKDFFFNLFYSFFRFQSFPFYFPLFQFPFCLLSSPSSPFHFSFLPHSSPFLTSCSPFSSSFFHFLLLHLLLLPNPPSFPFYPYLSLSLLLSFYLLFHLSDISRSSTDHNISHSFSAIHEDTVICGFHS